MKNNKAKILQRALAMSYFAACFSVCFVAPLQAYIDPATTAMITQIVAGVFISAGVAFGIFRRKIIFFFKNLGVKNLQRKIERQHK